jgi:hypothetical protein
VIDKIPVDEASTSKPAFSVGPSVFGVPGPDARESQSFMANIGKVGLPKHTAAALAASSLLTAVVLPERSPFAEITHSFSTDESQADQRMVVLQANGELLPASSRQNNNMNSIMLSDLQAGIENVATTSETAKLDHRHKSAMDTISALTGTNRKPLDLAQSIQFQQDVLDRQISIHLLSGSGSQTSKLQGTGSGQSQAPLRAASRASRLLSQLSLEMRNFGNSDTSIVFPVIPENIYQHTIAARPNFNEKAAPRRNYMFVLVNAAMIGALIAGAVLDVFYKQTVE